MKSRERTKLRKTSRSNRTRKERSSNWGFSQGGMENLRTIEQDNPFYFHFRPFVLILINDDSRLWKPIGSLLLGNANSISYIKIQTEVFVKVRNCEILLHANKNPVKYSLHPGQPNTIKYSPPGNKRPTVYVHTNSKRQHGKHTNGTSGLGILCLIKCPNSRIERRRQRRTYGGLNGYDFLVWPRQSRLLLSNVITFPLCQSCRRRHCVSHFATTGETKSKASTKIRVYINICDSVPRCRFIVDSEK